jgi:PAS domain S-box-containing protein
MQEASKLKSDIPLEVSISEARASLESILCTEELQRRPSRPPDYEKENRALVALMSALADLPSTIFQALAETILDITQCDSAGLSLLTRDGKRPDVCGKRFYWPAIAGMWNPHVGGGTPRNFGPCGDVLDQNRTLLFRHFERRYPYLMPVIPAAEECLLVPFYVAGEAVGTIWAIMHSDHRKFDAEDERVMASLGKFASSAYQTLAHLEDLTIQVAEREKAEAEVRELASGLEAKIRRLVEANVVGIVMWNLEGAITEANDAFLRMVQYDREDLASGRVRWTDLTPVEWRDCDERAIADLKACGIVQPFEKEYFRKDGSRVPILLGGALFEGSGNEGVAFVLDLTEQKRAEEALGRSEAYLAEAQRLSHTGSWYWNVGTGEVVWSQEFFAIFGLDSEKTKASYPLYLECIHPEDRSRVEETRRAALRDKRDFEAEYRLLLPGGLTKYLHGIGHFLESHSGDVEYIGAVIDITERKKEESARRYSEEGYRVVIETANDAVVTTDESGAILFANPATTRVFGYDPTELIGKPLTVLMPEFMRQLHENGFRRYLATGQRHLNWQGTELTGLRKNGQEFPAEVSFGELTKSEQRVFTGFIRDISERKQAEQGRERLRQAQADLAHVNRVSTMGELTASLAHEIKQPMFAAAADSETCLRWLACPQPDVAEAQEAALRLMKDVTRASDIINRIGSLFKKDVPKRELVDINELIREMIALLRSEASKYSITIHGDLADGLPKIMADRVGLQQVLMNLMLNGVEAMKDMTAPGTLTIMSRRGEDGELAVSILDTGVGVPPEQIDQIFSAFITSKPQGTGMGLPISRSIIESHGGRLWATSNTGPGATFQFVLPIEPSAQQTA